MLISRIVASKAPLGASVVGLRIWVNRETIRKDSTCRGWIATASAETRQAASLQDTYCCGALTLVAFSTVASGRIPVAPATKKSWS